MIVCREMIDHLLEMIIADARGVGVTVPSIEIGSVILTGIIEIAMDIVGEVKLNKQDLSNTSARSQSWSLQTLR